MINTERQNAIRRVKRFRSYVDFCWSLYSAPIYSKRNLFTNLQYIIEQQLNVGFTKSCELAQNGRDAIIELRKENYEFTRDQFVDRFILFCKINE